MSSPAASSSTVREETNTTGKHNTASNGNLNSTQRSNASRMSRTLNTIPVWARQDPPSPPASPTRENAPGVHDRSRNASNTWPKAPKPAFLQAPQEKNRREIDESRPMSSSSSSASSHDAVGPSRFWSFTIPARMRGAGGGNNNDGPKRKDTSSDQSSDEEGEVDPNRRPSMNNVFASSLGDTFANFAFGSRRRQSSSATDQENEKQEEQGDADPMEEWTRDSELAHAASRQKSTPKKREERGMEADNSFSRHQPLTPGWESPWHPESRGEHSIEFGKYRFNNHGEGGYFPRTETTKSMESRKRKRKVGNNGMTIIHKREKSSASAAASVEWWKHFLLHNPFVPLLFRTINVAITTVTLAIAIKLQLLLKSEGAESAVGSSPVVAIIFAPLTLLHVGIQIWLEYFSRPIGLWRVGSKLFYTLIELVFVCFWSAELSLSFDNYFTSTLVCTTFNSPYANQSNGNSVGGEQILNDPSKKPTICQLQGALIGLVFTSLLAYVVVLAVSLFRIFVRVSRR